MSVLNAVHYFGVSDASFIIDHLDDDEEEEEEVSDGDSDSSDADSDDVFENPPTKTRQARSTRSAKG